MKISRRKFIKQVSIVTLGFTAFTKLAATQILTENKKFKSLNLQIDPKGILNLPKGFTYKIISKHKDLMDDGLLVPNKADGMSCFKSKGSKVILVRNHELGHFPNLGKLFNANNPFGKNFSKYLRKNKKKIYDMRRNKISCFGCTTTIVYDLKDKKTLKQFLSLSGTLVNCSGGPTPWKSWISCEETVKIKGPGLNKNHGYNFEVPATSNIKLHKAVPFKAMGRFKHEAIAVDQKHNFIYQTEDRKKGLFYRFIPNKMGDLARGGKLQALSLKNFRGTNCSNWHQTIFKIGQKRIVRWVDLEDVDSLKDDLRIRGENKGCATFARGEGLWYADDYVYFTASTGGKDKKGQIWRYQHVGKRGVQGELELFFECDNENYLAMPDNITVSPWGDIIVSEDHLGHHDRLVGIKPDGTFYHLAKNILNKSEFAGATFSPDGSILFVNIYKPAMTFAIEGPWSQI